MEIVIKEEKENPLLSRVEMVVDILHNGATPRKIEVRDKIAALKNVDKLTVVVDRLVSKFGARESQAFVKIYKTREILGEKGEKKEEKEQA